MLYFSKGLVGSRPVFNQRTRTSLSRPRKASLQNSGVIPRGCTTPYFPHPIPPCQLVNHNLGSIVTSGLLVLLSPAHLSSEESELLTKTLFEIYSPTPPPHPSYYTSSFQSRTWLKASCKHRLAETGHHNCCICLGITRIPRTQFTGLGSHVGSKSPIFGNISLGPVT